MVVNDTRGDITDAVLHLVRALANIGVKIESIVLPEQKDVQALADVYAADSTYHPYKINLKGAIKLCGVTISAPKTA